MGFEEITDTWGRTFRPAKRFNRRGIEETLSFIEPVHFGGMSSTGLISGYENEELPVVYGLIRAIRHDSPVCLTNLSRADGGLMPGDLVHFHRYTAQEISQIDVITVVDIEGVPKEYSFRHPLLVILDSEIYCRVDDIYPDPWNAALERLNALPKRGTLVA